jgi:hypothetical protein
MSSELAPELEVRSPLDRQTLYFILGSVTTLIRKVKAEEDWSLTRLRMFLSALTTPPEEMVSTYLSSQGLDQHSQHPFDETNTDAFFEGVIKGLRVHRSINWSDWEDPLLRETMLDDGALLDHDTTCMVTHRGGMYNIRWVLPKPEIYWNCSDPDKLIHIALIALEELIHLNQIKGKKIELHTFGVEYDLSDERLSEMSKYVIRMMEIDVANVLSTSLPEMVEQNWQWYADRQSKPKHDDYYPLATDYAFLLGLFIAAAMGQEANFLAGAMTSMPKYLDKNHSAREVFFSNPGVLRYVEDYLRKVYSPPSEDGETVEGLETILSHEFSPDGITFQFLMNCLVLRSKEEEDWLEVLDTQELGVDGTSEEKYGADIIKMIQDFLNSNPEYLINLTGEKQSFLARLFRRKMESPDQLLDVLS